jgi:anti-sigma regulatory factor (Ser/Thr protein kinase)
MMRMQEVDQGRDMAEPVEISLSIPSKPEYIALCRLTVGAIGSREGLDGETVADLKVAVTEAATWLMGGAGCPVPGVAGESSAREEPGLTVAFSVSPDVWNIEVSHPAARLLPETTGSIEDNLGLTIIEALVDEMEQREDPERGIVLRLVKHLSDASRSRDDG